MILICELNRNLYSRCEICCLDRSEEQSIGAGIVGVAMSFKKAQVSGFFLSDLGCELVHIQLQFKVQYYYYFNRNKIEY